MKKLVYTLGGLGLLFSTACNEPATFDQTAADRRADSLALARTESESPSLFAEYDETCSRQLQVLELTRDSLSTILNTSTPGKKSSGTKTTPTPTPTDKDPKLDVKGGKGDGKLDVKGSGKSGGGKLDVDK